MISHCWSRTIVVSTVACFFFASSFALGGVSYQDPTGGWRYTYDGTFQPGLTDADCVGGTCPPGYGTSDDEQALRWDLGTQARRQMGRIGSRRCRTDSGRQFSRRRGGIARRQYDLPAGPRRR